MIAIILGYLGFEKGAIRFVFGLNKYSSFIL
jgi:hypothetical protein